MANEEKDRISEIFLNRTVFITGGSGFLGKVLIEKLLRCTEVRRIYVLIRSKRGKSPQERLCDIFNNMLFDTLKKQRPSFLEKCHVIDGDVSQNDLGITFKNRLLLEEEVEFIFHSAANVHFDDSVKSAVCINTRGTKFLLDFAAKCKNLKICVHISTAFTFINEKILYEMSYPAPVDVHYVLDIVKAGKDDECEKLLGNYPNAYPFSKALAEQLVVEQMENLPVIIVRPSTVCPTYQDPIPGWCNNLQGAMGLFVAGGKGVLRSIRGNGDLYSDFVPADWVINGMLIATWNFLKFSKKDRIFNLTSPKEIVFSWGEVIRLALEINCNDIPFNGVFWYPRVFMTTSRIIYSVWFCLFQMLPAVFIDLILVCLGYKPVLLKIQRRVQKGCEMFEFYTTKPWSFSRLKLDKTILQLNKREKADYKIDGEDLDVKAYLKRCILCLRRNILKEPDDTLPAARRHMKVMYVVDIISKMFFALVIFYYICKWMSRAVF